MAKRKKTTTRRASRSTRSRAGNIEESGALAASATERIIELDLDALADAGTTTLAVDTPDASACMAVTDDLLQARNEMLERLFRGEPMAEARAFSSETDGLYGLDNVRGVGVGLKETNSGYTGDACVKVFVGEKVPSRRLSADHEIPPDLAGVPTDVEVAGDFRAASYARRFDIPVPSGVSCGHVDVTAGTIGCLVVLNNRRLAILSNNHILANENQASVGDNIVQPGPRDRRSNTDVVVGLLEQFIPLNFNGTNLVDAAVAHTSFDVVARNHVTYNLNPTPIQAAPLMVVMKNGRTTQATTGWVSATNVDGVPVDYRRGRAFFNNTIVVRSLANSPFSSNGDSGSLIVSATSRQPAGLLFAGSDTHTLANPIGTVMTQLGIDRFIGPN